MTRIALDAMGGDNAPGEIVRGGVEAAAGLEDVKVFLVGVKEQIDAELAKYPKEVATATKKGTLEVIHAPDVAEMDESPVTAVRKKKDCSINVAMRLVKEGRADAFVSAGNSGAVATSARSPRSCPRASRAVRCCCSTPGRTWTAMPTGSCSSRSWAASTRRAS